MRTAGSQTKKNCWNCQIKVNNQELLNMDFPSLSKIAEELGLTRNVVNEIVNNRRKQRSGKYDTKYLITKI
jgi:hypothetical protein